MKKRTIAVVAALGTGLFFATRDDESPPAPDERLASAIVHMCPIAEQGAKDPRAGLRRLAAYLAHHGPTMMKDFGDTIVAIERIAEDLDHDARAALAGRRLRAANEACPDAWEAFDAAVGGDPEAIAMLERANERLGRTFELIFGQGGPATLRDLRSAFVRELDAVQRRY